MAKVEEKGLTVRFYNNVKGWVPLAELPQHQRNLKENFEAGQTVKCRVVRVNKDKKKLTCSLLSSEQATRMCKQAVEGYEVGQVVQGVVVSKNVRHVVVEVKKDATTCRALLEPVHLSDDEQMSSKLFHELQAGDVMEQVPLAKNGRNNRNTAITRSRLFCPVC